MRNFVILFFVGAFFIFSQNCSQLQSGLQQSLLAEDKSLELSTNLDQDLAFDNLWIGPMAFGPDDTSRGWAVPTLRPGYSEFIEKISPQDLDAGKIHVLKTYIMVLPSEVSSDDQLRALIMSVNRHHLKVAIEVGGMRTSQFCGANAGISNASQEVALLQRWSSLGGRIDFLTTDHSIMSSLATPLLGSGLGNPNCRMTLDQLIDEQINYFATIKDRYPKVKLGMIESLGYFNFRSAQLNNIANNKTYDVTDSRLPGWDLNEILTKLIQRGQSRGITLDHFHLDFSLEGVEFDGRSGGGLRTNNADYGRIALVQSLLRQLGIRTGIIVNADGQDHVSSESSAVQRTMRYLKELNSFSQLNFDQIIFQSWFTSPSVIGDWSIPNSGVGLIHSLLQELGSKTCSFNYAPWSECNSSSLQTRILLSALPIGCSGRPETLKSCNYTAPTCSFTYSDWGACQVGNVRYRTETSRSPNGCNGNPVLEDRTCTYSNPEKLTAGLFRFNLTSLYYTNGADSYCLYNNWERFKESTGITDVSTVRNLTTLPEGLRNDGQCFIPDCTATNYSAWSECQPNNTQTRTVVSRLPNRCAGGEPLDLNRSCIYDPGISEGVFRVNTAIFYSNGLKHYCIYNDWEKFKRATGISDINLIRNLPSISSVMISDGNCVVP